LPRARCRSRARGGPPSAAVARRLSSSAISARMAAWLARNSLDLQSIFEAIADTNSSSQAEFTGKILFSGKRIGYAYSGIAYLFSKDCGTQPYEVSGTVSTDERVVTLNGRKPTLDPLCRDVGFENPDMTFTLEGVIRSKCNRAHRGGFSNSKKHRHPGSRLL